MPNPNRKDFRSMLTRALPAFGMAKFGALIYDMIDAINRQNAVLKTIVTKLNADAGVADTNYTAATLVDVKKPEDR